LPVSEPFARSVGLAGLLWPNFAKISEDQYVIASVWENPSPMAHQNTRNRPESINPARGDFYYSALSMHGWHWLNTTKLTTGDSFMKLKASLALAFGLMAGASFAADTELVIATVNNGHMIEMQKLSKNFEQANPDIKLKWVTLEEGVLRQRVTTDIATKGGQFDVMTIGMYETPIWAKKAGCRN